MMCRRLFFGLAVLMGAQSALAQNLHTDKVILNTVQQPTTGTGTQVHQDATYDVTVPASGTLSLMELSARQRNSTTGNSLLYNLVLNTESDGIDNGAALAVFNTGKADGIYLGLKGKSGAVSTNQPTGLGVDMNRGASAENSSTFNGFGAQIWDWSTTTTNNAIALVLKKASNRNTQNILLQLEGNRRLLEAFTTEADGAYDGTQPVFKLQDISNGTKWEVLANGTNEFAKRGLGIVWDMPSGNQPYIASSVATTTLDMRGGLSGIRILDQAGSSVNWAIGDTGDVTLRGNTTIPNTKGLFWTPVSGSQSYIVHTNADQLDIRGAASGFRVLNNGGSAANISMTDAGVLTLRSALAIDGGTPSTHGITIPSGTPSTTTANLYSPNGSDLYYNGVILSAGGLNGSGTTNTIPLFTAGSVIGNSVMTQSGTTITVATTLNATTLGATTVNATTANATTVNATTVAGTLSTAAQGNVTSLGSLTTLRTATMGINEAAVSNTALATFDTDGTHYESLFEVQRDSSTGPELHFKKARASGADNNSGDEIGGLFGETVSGGTTFANGRIALSVNGTYTSGQRPPSSWDIYTNYANSAPALAVRVQPSGAVSFGTTLDPNQSVSNGGGGRVLIGSGSLAGSMPALFNDDGLRVQVASASTTDKLAGFFGMTSTQNQTGGPQALEAYTYTNQTGTTSLAIAGISNIEHHGSGTTTTLKAHTTTVLVTGSGGGTDAIAYDANVVGQVSGGTGTYTNAYGVKVGGFGSGFTNKYSLFSSDSGAVLSNAGAVTTATGYRISGAATSGTVLRGDGTNYVASALVLPNAATTSQVCYANATNTISCGSANLSLSSAGALTAGPTSGSNTITHTFTAGGSGSATVVQASVTGPVASTAYFAVGQAQNSLALAYDRGNDTRYITMNGTLTWLNPDALTQTAITGTTLMSLSTAGLLTIVGGAVPSIDVSSNLGSASLRWNTVYIGIAASTGTAVVQNADGYLTPQSSSMRYKLPGKGSSWDAATFTVTAKQLADYLALAPKWWDYRDEKNGGSQKNGAAGFLAEQLDSLSIKSAYGTSPFVNYNVKGQPDSNRDFALIAMEHLINQEQETRIAALEKALHLN